MKSGAFQVFMGLIIILLIIWFVPGIAQNQEDKLYLTVCNLILFLVFSLGIRRMQGTDGLSQARFNARYFSGMALRMFTALGLIAIYLYISKIKNIAGAISLIISYFVYMGFEIRIILHKLRTDSEKSQDAVNARK